MSNVLNRLVGRKVDLQVREDTNKNNHGAGARQEPASEGTSVHKEQTNAQKQGQQGQPKGIVAPPAPGSTGHHHLIGEEIAACDNHDEAKEKGPYPSGRAARSPRWSMICVYHTSGLDASVQGSCWCIHVLLET